MATQKLLSNKTKRAININVLQRLKYDYESYKKNADDEMRCVNTDVVAYNFWRGKEQATKEVLDMLECNIVEEKDLWKL